MILSYSVLIRYASHAREQMDMLSKMGFGLTEFFHAKLPKPSEGATMSVTEGLVGSTTNGKLTSIRKSRTISPEL
jgi:hypothetical protein